MKKLVSVFTLLCFLVTSETGNYHVYAQAIALPTPGTMVDLSPAFEPVLIKGLKVHPENPFLFDFIIDTGNDFRHPDEYNRHPERSEGSLKEQSAKLIKYFLASLTIPEKDLWVNLSPYEKDRMIAPNLGQTEMGCDMLAEDYILKQLTASLIYPEKHLGKTFWDEVYTKARQQYGITQVPVNTFNKVWIVADKADIFEHGNAAYIVGAHLKVMLEEDYMALQKHSTTLISATRNDTHSIAANIIRQIILPQIEKEVNTGQNFAPLRQMFYSMILASWYKMALKDALLTQIYGNKSKVKVGVNQADPKANEEIFQRYLRAYKKGVFNYIKEESTETRKYFSGGFSMAMLAAGKHSALHRFDGSLPAEADLTGNFVIVSGNAAMIHAHGEANPDAAMRTAVSPNFVEGQYKGITIKVTKTLLEGEVVRFTVDFLNADKPLGWFFLERHVSENKDDILKIFQHRLSVFDMDPENYREINQFDFHRIVQYINSNVRYSLAGKKILLVGSDPEARQLHKKVLMYAGAVVTESENEEQSLRILQRGKQFDLILTDSITPGIDGMDLARRTQLIPSQAGAKIMIWSSARLLRGEKEFHRYDEYRIFSKNLPFYKLTAIIKKEIASAGSRAMTAAAQYIADARDGIVTLEHLKEVTRDRPTPPNVIDWTVPGFKINEAVNFERYGTVKVIPGEEVRNYQIARGYLVFAYERLSNNKVKIVEMSDGKFIDMISSLLAKNVLLARRAVSMSTTIPLMEKIQAARAKIEELAGEDPELLPRLEKLADRLAEANGTKIPNDIGWKIQEYLTIFTPSAPSEQQGKSSVYFSINLGGYTDEIAYFKYVGDQGDYLSMFAEILQKDRQEDKDVLHEFLTKMDAAMNTALPEELLIGDRIPNRRQMGKEIDSTSESIDVDKGVPLGIARETYSLGVILYFYIPDSLGRISSFKTGLFFSGKNKREANGVYRNLESQIADSVKKGRYAGGKSNNDLISLAAKDLKFAIENPIAKSIKQIQLRIRALVQKESGKRVRVDRELILSSSQKIGGFAQFDVDGRIKSYTPRQTEAKKGRIMLTWPYEDGTYREIETTGKNFANMLKKLWDADPRLADAFIDSAMSVPVVAQKQTEVMPKRKERRLAQSFDLDKTIDFIVKAFRHDKERLQFPGPWELSILGPVETTFSNHYQEIILTLQTELNQRKYDHEPKLKERLNMALQEKMTAIKYKKRSEKFDPVKTIDFIIKKFRTNDSISQLPGPQQLSKNLGPTQTTFSQNYQEVLKGLQVRLDRGDYDQESRLKERLGLALTDKKKKMAERKKPQTFYMKRTIDFIVKKFRDNGNVRKLPGPQELSNVLELHQVTLSNHYPEILVRLRVLLNRGEYNQEPQLKERLNQALKDKMKEIEERKKPERFDLKNTIDFIIKKFRANKEVRQLPRLSELSISLGPSQSTFSRNYQKVYKELRTRLERGDFDQESGVKERLIQALSDSAMNGGIDFNSRNMFMNVRKEGQGVQMRFDPAMIERIKQEGFDGMDFQIHTIVPVTDLPQFLGLK